MKHLLTIWTAVVGLIALAAPFSPALADEKAVASYVLADMVQKPGAPVPGAMPGGMMDDKMGAMPPAAPSAAAPAAEMAPAPQPGAPASGGMPGMMMDDKMAMPSADAAASAMPGMPPPAPSAPPGGMPAQMMQMMQTMMPKAPGQPSAPLDHVEGRIAFIRAELGITDAQVPAWDAFAQALRSGRDHLAEARQALSASAPSPAGGQSNMASRLEAYERHLSMRLDSVKAARVSYQRLDPMLTAAQKQTASELVAPLLLSF